MWSFIKKDYDKPVVHFAPHIGELANDEIVLLTDDRLQEYLAENGFQNVTRLFRTNDEYMLRDIAGESVLIPIGESAVFGNSILSLNETCRFLWEQFKQPRTIYDVYVAAKEEYQDSTGRMLGGILSFVKEYLNVGLLKEE